MWNIPEMAPWTAVTLDPVKVMKKIRTKKGSGTLKVKSVYVCIALIT